MRKEQGQQVDMSHDTRVASTLVLLDLIERGVKFDFNRQLDIVAVTRDIDMDGFHILRRIIAFHEQYKPNVDHHRAWVFLKVKGSDEPVQLIMDISDTDWNQLITPDGFTAAEKSLGI